MIFFLGLDGLDCKNAEKWDCTSLLQAVHGELEVPVNPYRGCPISPEVWGCFLTGRQVGHLEFKMQAKIKGGVTIFKTLAWLKKHIPLGFGLGHRVASTPSHYPALSFPTFLDLPGTCGVNVPFRDYDHEIFKLANLLGTEKLSFEQYKTEVVSLYEKRKMQLIDGLEKAKDKRLAFFYMEFPDGLEHAFCNDGDFLRRHYEDLDGYVKHFKSLADSDVFFIVSDHGFNLKTGNHSNRGFWSCDKLLADKPLEVTDFYRIVTE